jgi:cysteine desulfurase
MKTINFDHLGYAPVTPEVREAMLPYLSEKGGNPLSKHLLGESAGEAIEQARAAVADLIHANPEEVIFTSCGSESNNLAIKGIAQGYAKKGRHIIASPIEHHSILHPLKRLEKQGGTVSWLTVGRDGKVDPEEVLDLIGDETVLVTVTSASNEIGTLEPIKTIGRITREKGVAFHTDAVASAGSIPLDVRDLHVDLLSLSGNTFYGPPGTGALFVRKGIRILPLIEGGIQEKGGRAGTHNVPGIVGMGVAAELAREKLIERREHVVKLRDRLIASLSEKIPDCFLTGHPVERLPGHASFCIQFIEGESILIHLNFLGMAATSGSTCSSEALKVSHVLEALGIDPVSAQGSVVFSLGVDNTEEEIELLETELPPIVEKLRRMSPLAMRNRT